MCDNALKLAANKEPISYAPMKATPLTPAKIDDLSFVGNSLSRPECALAHASGAIFAPDWTDFGGVTAILPNGDVKRHLATNWDAISKSLGLNEPLRPNGICLLEGGDFLLAHLGEQQGGIFRLAKDGTVSIFLSHIHGEPLPPCNFVTVDERGRVWITVSTRKTPRALAYRKDVADGFIALIENGSARIVADGLGYTNECVPHPDGKRLFVNETFCRRLTSFDIEQDGSLTNRTTIAELASGTFPDGLAFDYEGNAWLTSIVSNRVLRVDAGGRVEIFLEDADSDHLAWVEQAWIDNAMGRPHLDKAAGRVLKNISNLAFCGPELDQGVMGCLLGTELALVDMPVAGNPPVHWTFDIQPLIDKLMYTLNS